MAVYKIFPEKDATIYSYYPARNTGIDEIIEASTIPDVTTGSGLTPQISRFLIQFPSSEITNIIQNKVSGSSFDAYLKVFLANASYLNADYTIYCYPLSQSWNMGTGRFQNSPETRNGVCWGFTNRSGSNPWNVLSPGANATSSYIGNIGGGVWYTGSSTLDPVASQSFTYITNKDLNLNVTNTVLLWYSGSIPNYGFIVKRDNSLEFSTSSYSNLKYFSMDTNTIYPPQLEIRWNDYYFNTGSSAGTIITSSEVVLTLANNKNEYQQDSIQRFRINVRDKYPSRVFQTSSIYLSNRYLPISSYYSVVDLDTNETSIDFHPVYTKISADSVSNYFDIYMNGLEPERYYKFLFKVVLNGETLIFDDNYYFKILM